MMREWLPLLLLPCLLAVIECSEEEQCSIIRKGEMQCYYPGLSGESRSLSSSNYRSVRRLRFYCRNPGKFTRPDTFSRLPRLRHLLIRDCNLDRVQDSLLADLDQLRSLDLSHNQINGLSSFCSLNSLQTLNLSHNNLRDLSDLGPAPCRRSLHSLDLSHNALGHVTRSILGQFGHLESLDLSHNDLSLLADDSLIKLTSLMKLDVSNNALVALPSHLFSDCCDSLTELHLQHNSLSYLPASLLANLEHLVMLNLSHNALDEIGANMFVSLVRLVALDLSHNNLRTLDQGLLSGLTALQLLDLSHNQLRYLPAHGFVSQVNLHMLKLAFNSVDEIHVEALVGLDVLSALDLAHNNMASLPDAAMASIVSVVDVNLSHNKLKRVPRALQRLPALRTLDLSQNFISNLSKVDLGNLNNLDALALSANNIEDLEADVFELVPKIQILNLADNRLKTLNLSIFNALNELSMLRLDSNLLGDINGLLAGQTTLKWLNVSNNRLPWFDYAFIPRSLQWLDVSHNEVEELGNFYKLQDGFGLKTLIAEYNNIKRIEALSIPDDVQVVRLRGNQINSVDAGTFGEKSKLRSVDLSLNQLQSLQLAQIAPRITKKDPTSVVHFRLADNPFRCDCHMDWIKRVNDPINSNIQNNDRNEENDNNEYNEQGDNIGATEDKGISPNEGLGLLILDLDELTCVDRASPSMTSSTRMMTSLPRSSFLCYYEAHCFALCLCCDFFACDCRMQCPQGCHCLHDSSWSLNIIECSNRRHREVPPLIPMDATAIFLDGNNFTGILESQAFIGRKRVREMYLNNSLIEAISNQTFNGLSELQILHLENNKIARLEGYEFSNLTALTHLYLHHNLLHFIDLSTFDALQTLQVLDLSHNKLHTFPVWILIPRLAELRELRLADNAWSCECDFVNSLQHFDPKSIISDYSELYCLHNENDRKVSLKTNLTCSEAQPVVLDVGHVEEQVFDLIPLLVALAMLALLVSCTSVLVFVFRTPLRVWMHSKYNVRILQRDSKAPSKHCAHAFLSFALEDSELVLQALLPHLEQQYRIILQNHSNKQMDRQGAIMNLKSCSRHVILLSRAFVQSEWTRVCSLRRQVGKKRAILIVLEPLSSVIMAAHPELELLVKSSVLLKWNETGFWNKLRFYLPDANRESILELSHYEGTLLNAKEVNCNDDLEREVNNGGRVQIKQRSGWAYSGLISNNNTSSASPLNTTHCTSSPARTSSSSESTNTQLLSNNPSEHIYHTLEDSAEMGFDALGRLDVMLPNGQFVPATLVRSHGHVVPVVDEACVNNLGLSPRNNNNRSSTLTSYNSDFRRMQQRQRASRNRHFV